MSFEPKIVCFLCKWCTYAAADLAGTMRMKYPPNGIIIRVMCSSRVDVQHVLWAFKNGADGVFVGGCRLGECHYKTGNYKTQKRMILLKKLLNDLGIEEERLHVEWISASEGKKFVEEMNNFIRRIKLLGKLRVYE